MAKTYTTSNRLATPEIGADMAILPLLSRQAAQQPQQYAPAFAY